MKNFHQNLGTSNEVVLIDTPPTKKTTNTNIVHDLDDEFLMEFCGTKRINFVERKQHVRCKYPFAVCKKTVHL